MMNKPLRIGITGGIGSGKSTVTQIFKLLGIPVYDADSAAKRLMEENDELAKALKNNFGNKSFINGKLNRQYLADAVFGNDHLLKKINSLVHPVVAKDCDSWSMQYSSGYILKEAALLFETGTYHDLDEVLLVFSDQDTRIRRIKKRDPQRTSKQILNIIGQQMPANKAKDMADYIIYNDEEQMLIPQVLKIHSQLIKKT